MQLKFQFLTCEFLPVILQNYSLQDICQSLKIKSRLYSFYILVSLKNKYQVLEN